MDDDNPALYDVARQVCHQHGIAWTDPRTGVTYPPPRCDHKFIDSKACVKCGWSPDGDR